MRNQTVFLIIRVTILVFSCICALPAASSSHTKKSWLIDYPASKATHHTPPNNVSLYVIARNPITLPPTKPIVRYDIQNGKVFSKTTVTSHRSQLLNNCGFEFYKDMYLIGSTQQTICIYDLTNKKVAFSDFLTLICQHNSELILSDGKRYQSFDLTTGKSKIIKRRSHWDFATRRLNFKLPLLSPDNTMSIIGINSILLRTQNKPTRILLKNINANLSRAASFCAYIPMLWLDNKTILTQRSNGNIISVDMHSNVTPIAAIDIEKLPNRPPKLYFDPENRIIYNCNKDYIIDLRNKRYRHLEYHKLGFGFDHKYKPKAVRRWLIRHNRITIGTLHSNPNFAVCAPGHIATMHLNEKRHSRSVIYWSSHDRKWKQIDPESKFDSIIGWQVNPLN